MKVSEVLVLCVCVCIYIYIFVEIESCPVVIVDLQFVLVHKSVKLGSFIYWF